MRWRLALAGLLVVAIIAGTGVALRGSFIHPRDKVATPAQLVIDPLKAQLACVQDATWSPDGTRLAFLGYQATCPFPAPSGYVYSPGMLVLYDSATGKVATHIAPDDLIDASLHILPPGQGVTPQPGPSPSALKTAIQYSRVLWSPNGTRLALPFSLEEIKNVKVDSHGGVTGNVMLLGGVLVLSPTGKTMKVVSHTFGANEMNSGLWDLADGTYIPAPKGATYFNIQPAAALSYTWNAAGTLEPRTPLAGPTPVAAPPLGPIGNPAGDPSFTLWQPATMRAFRGGDGINTPIKDVPGLYTYSYALTSWSPDGRYLQVAENGFAMLLDPHQPGATPAQIKAARQGYELPTPIPLVPVRDKALSAVLAAHPPSDLTSINGFSFAWRPDGKRLAAVSIVGAQSSALQPGQYVITIYDCATGQRLASLPAAIQYRSQTAQSGTTLLRWSPDGSRLFLYDTLLNVATIWGPGKLPA